MYDLSRYLYAVRPPSQHSTYERTLYGKLISGKRSIHVSFYSEENEQKKDDQNGHLSLRI
ncbi:hypothetical protein TU50_00490 [Bacillus wiedmannii]|nr:hypothetical protein TU50_00490 [Bacillus wiedmannii]KXY08289.1 hypothetical protein AT260_09520 [Bacillus wiedmannii]OAK10266.1 hypothetical protein A6278_00725 [Bacillus wiedmannii]OAK43346.1 hypothetical protein A6285_00550 [Bacillus wiedmannii]PHB74360.1 hypothetical protein COE89_06215 [Bacillus wiedmannii]